MMKSDFPSQTRKVLRRNRSRAALLLSTALFAFALQSDGYPSESAPEDSMGGFFDLLLKNRVTEAAEAAVFSSDQARAEFLQQWTSEAPSLTGYEIEGWDIEARTGSGEVALKLLDPQHNRTLEVGLVKLDGVWRVAPRSQLELNPPAPSASPQLAPLEDLVDVTSVRKGNRLKLSVINEAPCSILLWFDVALPPSLKPDRPLPLQGIVPPAKDGIPLCDLRMVGGSPYSYSWRYSIKRGDDAGQMVTPGVLTPLPQVSQPDDPKYFVGEKYAYGLPYPAGRAYVIWQGPGGEFSHSEPGSRYAADFSLPLGSEIAAVRDGVVIGVIQRNPDNPDETPGPKAMANEILILHADGTIGVYAHLTTGGAKVSFGQQVRRGQIIGLSGNSGYSRGPHLHFDVLGYEEGQCVSTPYEFLSEDGSLVAPRKGLVLLAQNDGTARIVKRETTPWRVVYRRYGKFDTRIHYFAKSVEFLAANRTPDPLGVELSFTKLENAVSPDALTRRVALTPDGSFHNVLTLELVNPGEKSAFAYLFRQVEAPGMEHIPLRVERDDANEYVVIIRYFSDRIELYAENKTRRPMSGSLDFSSLTNLAPKETIPRQILLPADSSPHYLATLHLVEPAKGYAFRYKIGPSDPR
jgi:hypothetical protein